MKEMNTFTYSDDNFSKALSLAKEYIYKDIQVEKTLSQRSKEELELLKRLPIYKVAVPRDGIRKISLDLPKESLDVLVSFSLIEKKNNASYDNIEEYRISSLVYEFIKNDLNLNDNIGILASEYLFYLFSNSYGRKNLTWGLIAYDALKKVDKVEVFEEWLFDETEKDRDLRGVMLNNIAVQNQDLANYSKALVYLEKALFIQSVMGDELQKATTLSNIGSIYIVKGDLSKALEYLEKSLELNITISNKVGEGRTLGHIGVLYRTQNNFAKARKYHEKALDIQIVIDDNIGKIDTLNSLSLINEIQGNLEIALIYLKETLKICIAIGDKRGEGATLNNLSQIYRLEGNLIKSFGYLEESLKIKISTGDKTGEASVLNNMAINYEVEGNLSKALEYCKLALKINVIIGNKIETETNINNIAHLI